jgi:type VI secretion system protein ImpM
MQFGLFGKLQAKRDFIAVQTPRSFLSVFEPWMQSCISTSRMSLGAAWQNAFLTAPIWRFWLGPDLCGMPVAGAFMASMDGVGRYSPLAFLAMGEPGEVLPPPEIDPCESWYGEIEDFLLSTLDVAQPFEQTTAALAQFRPPPAVSEAPAHVRVITDRGCVLGRGEAGFATLFADARRADPAAAHAASTFWWTAGGEGYPPSTISAVRMPDPYLFVSMLTGDFSAVVSGLEGAT